MSTAFQPGFVELLERAGAHPPRHGRGKWRCGECGHPALSVNVAKELYHCFYAGCSFSGGTGTLRNRLGIRREWIPKGEWIRQQREQGQVHDAALRLYAAAKARCLALYDELRTLNRIEAGAHRIGPSEAVWAALAMVYCDRPAIEHAVDMLESNHPAEVLEALEEDKSVKTQQ